MNNKRALQLSINFIVVLVLALVLFGLASVFLKDIMDFTKDFGDLTIGDLEKRMAQISCGTEMVCLGPREMEIPKKKLKVFRINLYNPNQENDILVNIEFEPLGDAEDHLQILYGADAGNIRTMQLKAGEKDFAPVGVSPKKESETNKKYRINAKITYSIIDESGNPGEELPFGDPIYKLDVLLS